MTSREELLALAVHRETIKECIAVVEALFQSAAHGGAAKSDGLCPVPPGKNEPVSTETASDEGESREFGAAVRRMPDSESIGSLAHSGAATQCGNGVPPGPSDPALEPVAWRYRWKLDGEWTSWHVSDHSQSCEGLRDLEEYPLYTHPTPSDGAIREALEADELLFTVGYTLKTAKLLGVENEYRAHGSTWLAKYIAEKRRSALAAQPPAEKEG